MKTFTENDVRFELKRVLMGKTQAQLAKEIGVGTNFLSMVVNGAPVTGKILKHLGFRKIRIKLYEELP